MIKNYLKIAVRNIAKHKGFYFINVTGLAIGIACSILILFFVSHELSYDRFHEKADRIYRLAVRASIGDTRINQTYSSAITFQKLLEDFPEIETGVKFLNTGRQPVFIGDETFYEPNVFAVDSVFFDVFTFPLIHGVKETALTKPNTVVLTRETAVKYFGTTDVVGNSILFESNDGDGLEGYEITGVSEDVPEASHFHYNILISSTSFPDYINSQGWTNNNFISYIALKEGASKALLEEKLVEFTRKYMGGEQFDEWVAQGNFWEYYLQPITEIHLTSDLNGEFEANGNKAYVYIFSVVSVIILLVACINFMNLSTAKSSQRAKEVGIRKVVGSGRKRLIFQFLSESILLSFISLFVGLILVHALLPTYSNLLGKTVEIHYFDSLLIIPSLFALALFVGLVSGSYPAFFLSSMKPVVVLKSMSSDQRGGVVFRNVLVVLQFAISVFLLVGTFVVYKQLQFLQDTKLGFDKEQVLVINNPGSLGETIHTLKETIKQHNTVLDVSGANTLPGKSFSNIGFGAEGVEENFTLNLCISDYDYLNTLNIDLKEGRFFSREFGSDSSATVLNEATVALLDWEDPIGKTINNWSGTRGEFTVIGVVEDYHYESLHSEIRPMALMLNGGYYTRNERFISVRFETEDLQETIRYIEDTWETFAPQMPFEYSFLDVEYDNLYVNETQIRRLLSVFSFLAIFIACLGLFGLASFIVDQRTREIGIRKVFGASISSIVTTLNKSFVKLILVANIVAWPLAWYAMNRWLENFAYRIDLAWWMFLLAAALALVIALFVVSFQTVKAAVMNPVQSLQYE